MKFKWTKIKQDSFEYIKQIVSRATLLAYPYFNENFKIHTNASGFQLGAFINHNGKLIIFYSRTLTDPQKLYTVT